MKKTELEKVNHVLRHGRREMEGARATSLSTTLILLLSIKHIKTGLQRKLPWQWWESICTERKGDLLTKQPTDHLVTGMEDHQNTPSLRS
ncbi:hypothetical protein YC2023_092059 [Brassica napus]